MVPGPPFEDHVPGWIQFLDHQSGYERVRSSTNNDLAHIHSFRVVGEQQDIAIRQHLEIMKIGAVAVPGPVGAHRLVTGIHEIDRGVLLVVI